MKESVAVKFDVPHFMFYR